jgi:hypothetical protein
MPRKPGPEAPHGRDENGTPLAPYGLKVDGTPRLSTRGATAGGFGNKAGSTTARAKLGSLTDQQRKGMLCDLGDSFVVTPLATASSAPAVVSRIGGQKADALAGTAFIISQYAPHLADAMIVLSKTKPGALAWMDKAEQHAPYLMLMQVGVQMTKALVTNFINPDREYATAGRQYANMRLKAMANEINRQANQARDEMAYAETGAQMDEDTADIYAPAA